jgi:protein-histidine pros-kinase
MKLTLKINLVLLALFGVGLTAAGFISHHMLQQNARAEVMQSARIMMEAALAARAYTVQQIKPLLETQLKYGFLPQSVPSYSATEILNVLRKKYPDFLYKEAALNPTNPRDRASDWEADLIQTLRNNVDMPEIIGERDTPTGRALVLGRPLTIKDPKCLGCHSVPGAAPKTQLELYGENNGFGWKLNEVIGAQIVSVPMQLPIEKANQTFLAFMGWLVGLFAVLFVALNIMLHRFVTKPLGRLARVAGDMSKSSNEPGDLEAINAGISEIDELDVKSKDELGELALAIKRLHEHRGGPA